MSVPNGALEDTNSAAAVRQNLDYEVFLKQGGSYINGTVDVYIDVSCSNGTDWVSKGWGAPSNCSDSTVLGTSVTTAGRETGFYGYDLDRGNWSDTTTICPVGVDPNEPTPTPSPTPSPTPTPVVSYCTTVSGLDTDNGFSMLPNPRLGVASCTGWDEVTIDLDPLNLLPGLSEYTELYLPAVSICLRPIYFGNIQLFGMDIDLDIIAAVIAGVFFFRLFFRS
ncbi:MAG: hypothetical protein H7835_19030 [Magnetococcus sp. XQGC-1]